MAVSSTVIAASTEAVSARQRVEGFDFLRGLCAVAVACYHILSWQGAAHLHSWGRYGVYIFFVLSGASMYIAYNRRFEQGYDLTQFIVLRFARLAPLFIVVMMLGVALSVLKGRAITDQLSLALLNLTFIFGVGNPGSTSLVTGGWSLGIEFLFYLLFPVMLALVRGRYWAWLLAGSFICQHLFINHVLRGQSLDVAWVAYTQMLSFVFYFVAGCCIGRAVDRGMVRPSLLWVGVFVVVSLPLMVSNEEQNLIGIAGIGLSLCAALLVLASAGLPLTGMAASGADYLGKMSYGVYLIHPLVYSVTVKLIAPSRPVVIVTTVLLASAGLALLVDRFFEAPIRARVQDMFKARRASR